jgi:ATP-binding cassette subfamily B protein
VSISRWPFPRRIPFVAQMTASECPVACLAMVLAHHGRVVPRRRLRAALATGAAGASAHDLLEAVRSFGLIGRGVRRPAGNPCGLAPGSILHWNANHFVVLERAAADHAWILDPAVGRRRVDRATLERSFHGLALELSDDSPVAPGEPVCREASPSRQAIGRRVRARGFLAPILTVSLLSIALGLAAARMMAEVMARLLSPELRFAEIATGIAAIGLVTVVATTWRERRVHALAAALERDLERDLVARLVRLPLSFYRHRSTADLDARLTSVPGLSQRLARGLSSVLIDAPMVIAYLIALSWWSAAMGLADVVIAIGYLATSVVVRRARERDLQTVVRGDAEIRRLETQLLEQIASIKAAGGELAALALRERLQRDASAGADRQVGGHALGIGVLEARGVVIPLALLAVGGYAVMRGELSLPALIGTNYLACAMLRPLDALITAAGALRSVRQALDRIDDILLEPIPDHSSSATSVPIVPVKEAV